jgi:hypothetical protein
MAKCDNPNPGSSKNAGCNQGQGHQGNHSNGFSEWTREQGKGSGKK